MVYLDWQLFQLQSRGEDHVSERSGPSVEGNFHMDRNTDSTHTR